MLREIRVTTTHMIRGYRLGGMLEQEGDNLRGSVVVPPLGHCSTRSGHANQGSELQILAGELGELDAARAAGERIPKGAA